MEWKRLFKPHILERGYQYYLEGNVGDMKIADDEINAEVYGSEDYQVEIWLGNNEVDEMYCTCAYAEGGENCKHMAAVMFEYDELKNSGKNTDKSNEAVADAVNNADEEIVRNFLTEILKKDAGLFARFRTMVSKNIGKEDIDLLKTEASRIVVSHIRDGYIPYREAWDCCMELMEFVDENTAMLMDRGCLEGAFDLILHTFKVLEMGDVDDSDGVTSMVGNDCDEKLREIISKADIELNRRFYDKLMTYFQEAEPEIFTEYIEEILFTAFTGEEFLIRNFRFAEEMLRDAESKEDEFFSKYMAENWFERCVELMKAADVSRREIIDFCQQHIALSKARTRCIDEYCRMKAYPEAIELLKESIRLDKDYAGLVLEHKNRLKEIYRLTEDRDKYMETLWELAREELDAYKELKSQYTREEWLTEREKLFEGVTSKYYAAELYKAEAMYDKLLEYAVGAWGLSAAEQYFNELSKLYPRELLKKYRDELSSMVASVSDRRMYQQLVEILRKMKKISGGEQVVQDIVSEWRRNYKRRRAMMEELDKL